MCLKRSAGSQVTRCFMDNEFVLEGAIGLMGRVVADPLGLEELVRAGGVEALLFFLESNREDLPVAQKTLVALRRVVKSAEVLQSEGRSVPDVVTAIARPNFQGLAVIVGAMKFHVYDEQVCRESALLLLALCNAPQNLAPMLELGQDVCLNAMNVHSNTPAVQEALTSLLTSLPVEEHADFIERQPAPSLMATEA